MRIVIANWSRRKVGGAEAYIQSIGPALVNAGHEISYFCEVDLPADREAVSLPEGTPAWCFAHDRAGALARWRGWKPDLIFSHALSDPALEAEVITGRKAVFYAHNYSGSCISGTKTQSFPGIHPCKRTFGPSCLMQFYPRRCGGLNPMTGWQLYQRARCSREMLRHYSMILTASAHMRREYINQGFDRRRVRTVALIIDALPNRSIITDSDLIASSRRKFDANCLQLLFLGRMVKLKGGEKLLDAAPTTVASLQRPVRITFAGDGPARPDWARRAAWLEAGFRQIRVEFRGWTADLGELAMRSHLLVMPSLWPEPFGLSGLEIGRWGVPSVGFAVGGIPEWLLEGVNGHLAPSEPATAHGLANAIVHSLCDRDHYTRLCLGASARVDRYTAAVHVKRLTDIFDEVLGA